MVCKDSHSCSGTLIVLGKEKGPLGHDGPSSVDSDRYALAIARLSDLSGKLPVAFGSLDPYDEHMRPAPFRFHRAVRADQRPHRADPAN
jgi:hypothetical protein